MDRGFQEAAARLLSEAFEGMEPDHDSTWFVEKREGVFDALTSVSAELASRRPSSNCASIAAHAYHLLFLMRGANMCQGRPAPEGTWESSWEKQSVTDEEWAELIRRIREEYELYLGWFRENIDWTHEDAYISVLSPLPHVAFHLGAIRQILRIVNDRSLDIK